MEKEKIGNNELKALGINDVEVLVNFSRVANGLLKHNVMAKPEILANLEALIDDPMPYALKKGGKFKNLAEDVIALRKEGKFVKQQRSNFALKEEIADFPVKSFMRQSQTKRNARLFNDPVPAAHSGLNLTDVIIPQALIQRR